MTNTSKKIWFYHSFEHRDALETGLSVIDTSHHAFANLGWDQISPPAPVFIGDTLYAESQVLSKRESKSALWRDRLFPDAGPQPGRHHGHGLRTDGIHL